MRIFISGASGLVGGNCLKHFQEMGCEVIGSYFSYAADGLVPFDTLNLDTTHNFDLLSYRPDIIVHCGAMTHVDACETAVQESYEKTVQSTINLLSVAKSIHAKMVYISTDYVFDGEHGPYLEEEPVNPLSIYAQHKLEAEQMVLRDDPQHLVLRITNVYGDEIRNKNFIARIIEQCLEKKHLTLTLPMDQYATPVNAYDVARAMYLLLHDDKNGIYHIASTDWMNRVDLALNVLKYFPQATYTLSPKTTVELNQPANRPLRGGLHKIKFSNEYPEFRFTTVDEYVSNKVKLDV
jgi:dTDP-4-dehydrorhamnose reductase